MDSLPKIKERIEFYRSEKNPLSVCVRKAFQELIETKVFKEWQHLPTEKVMAEYFEISHVTLRKVLRSLEEQGYVHIKKRVAVVVRSKYPYKIEGQATRVGVLFWRRLELTNFYEYASQTIQSLSQQLLLNYMEMVPVYNQEKEDLLETVSSKKLDALIVLPNFYDNGLDYLSKLKIPKIAIEFVHNEEGFDSVVIDPDKGYEEVIAELVGHGNKTFAYIHGAKVNAIDYELRHNQITSSSYRRLDSIRHHLDAYGLELKDDFVFKTSSDTRDISWLVKDLVQRKKLPDVFFTYVDGNAMHLKRCLQKLKVRVPEDVSVVGYGAGSENKSQLISTIAPDWLELGNAAVSRLLERLRDPNMEDQVIKIPTSYIPGKSIYKPRKTP